MRTSRDLKQKLKASAKRRSRRMANAALPEPVIAGSGKDSRPPKVDVTELIVEEVLEESRLPPQLRDEEIVSALRRCSHGTAARNERAEALSERINQIPHQGGISEQAFRKSVDSLISVAGGQKGTGEVNPFLKLLRVLAR